MSNNLALIIPTKNRPSYLHRLLSYYRELEFPYKIVVADSSDSLESEENNKTVASFIGDLNLQYKQYVTDINIVVKCLDALKDADSKYIVFCADKDFIVPRTIVRAISFLDENPDYALVSGQAVLLSSEDNRNNIVARKYPQRAINGNNPCARLTSHLRNYTATFYSVHRRQQLLHNMQLARELTVDLRFGELLLSCLSVIQGKIKCLDSLYLVRQAVAELSTSKGETSIYNLLLSSDYYSRYDRFRNCLIDELEQMVNTPKEDLKKIVNEAFLSYLAYCFLSGYGRQQKDRQDIGNNAPLHAIWKMYSKGRAIIGRHLNNDNRSINVMMNKRSLFYVDFAPIYNYIKPTNSVAGSK